MRSARCSICTAPRYGPGFPGYLTGLLTIRPLARLLAKKGNRIVHPPSPLRLEVAAEGNTQRGILKKWVASALRSSLKRSTNVDQVAHGLARNINCCLQHLCTTSPTRFQPDRYGALVPDCPASIQMFSSRVKYRGDLME